MYSDVLRNRQFLKLWGAQLTSQIAAQLLNYGLLIRIYEITSKSSFANSAVSLLIVAIGLPAIFLAVPAGAYADHRDRKTILVWTNALRALLVPLLIVFDMQILAVYVLVFLISVFSQFFVPAEGAALPKLVPKRQLVAANSLFIFTLNASFIIGYSLAGPVIAKYGIHSVYLLVTAAFLVAMALSAWLPRIPAAGEGRFDFRGTLVTIFRDLKNHFGKIIGSSVLLFPIVLIALAQTIVGVIAALAPALSQTFFQVGLEKSSYWLVMPAGIGLVLGSVFAAKLLQHRNKVKIIFAALFLASGLLIALPLIGSQLEGGTLQVATAVMTFTLGVFNAVILVSAQTLLQYASTDRLRGQVFGTLNMMINIAALVPVFAAGLLADTFNALAVIAGVGALLFIVAVFLVAYFRGISAKYA